MCVIPKNRGRDQFLSPSVKLSEYNAFTPPQLPEDLFVTHLTTLTHPTFSSLWDNVTKHSPFSTIVRQMYFKLFAHFKKIISRWISVTTSMVELRRHVTTSRLLRTFRSLVTCRFLGCKLCLAQKTLELQPCERRKERGCEMPWRPAEIGSKRTKVVLVNEKERIIL